MSDWLWAIATVAALAIAALTLAGYWDDEGK